MSTLDLRRNPFFILGLEANASVVEIERQTARLLAEIDLGRPAAALFDSPFGPQPRDEVAIRAAGATLRDPRMRAVLSRFVPPRTSWVKPEEVPADERQKQRFPELAAAVIPDASLRMLLGAERERQQ